jgi:hypothetical protein
MNRFQDFLLQSTILLLTPLAAQAAIFSATYTLETGDVVEFFASGTAGAGGDIVTLDSMLIAPTFNGVDPNLINPTLSSDVGDRTGPATVSFSGDTMDMIWQQGSADDGFVFRRQPEFSYGAGPSFGINESDGQSRWQVTVIPEPSRSMLLFLSIGAVVLRRKRNS